MIVRKIFIRFCKNIESFVMKSINVQGGFLFCAGWNFQKIGKRDITFIREMRVMAMCNVQCFVYHTNM